MPETALDRFWELVWKAIALQPEAFEQIQTLPLATETAFLVLIMAGFSQAIAQGIILFVNRVKPIRFLLSLLISSLLFAVSNGFWILSTWGVSYLIFHSNVSVVTVFRTLGLAQAPLILSFFLVIPYLGTPLSALLSLWTLLAFVLGFDVLTDLNTWQAFGCGALGWGVLQILQRTIGRPAATIGQWLSNRAAGVNLVTDIQGIEKLVEAGLQITEGRKDRNDTL